MADFEPEGSNTLEGSSPLLTTLVTCTAILFFKHVWTLTMQGGAAIKANERIEEDYAALGLPRPLEVTEEAKADDKRWRRIVANDLENIPLGLIVLWSAAMATSAEGSDAGIGVIILTVVFTVARYIYTYCYVKALQPLRTIAWMTALLAVVTAAVLGIVVSFKNQFQ